MSIEDDILAITRRLEALSEERGRLQASLEHHLRMLAIVKNHHPESLHPGPTADDREFIKEHMDEPIPEQLPRDRCRGRLRIHENSVVHRVMVLLKETGPLSRREIERRLDLDRHTLSMALDRMKHYGAMTRTGSKRSTVWSWTSDDYDLYPPHAASDEAARPPVNGTKIHRVSGHPHPPNRLEPN